MRNNLAFHWRYSNYNFSCFVHITTPIFAVRTSMFNTNDIYCLTWFKMVKKIWQTYTKRTMKNSSSTHMWECCSCLAGGTRKTWMYIQYARTGFHARGNRVRILIHKENFENNLITIWNWLYLIVQNLVTKKVYSTTILIEKRKKEIQILN